MNNVTLAYKYEGEYYAETVYSSVEDALSNAELEDVINHEYQIWDLNTDKVYDLSIDDTIDSKEHLTKRIILTLSHLRHDGEKILKS